MSYWKISVVSKVLNTFSNSVKNQIIGIRVYGLGKNPASHGRKFYLSKLKIKFGKLPIHYLYIQNCKKYIKTQEKQLQTIDFIESANYFNVCVFCSPTRPISIWYSISFHKLKHGYIVQNKSSVATCQ